MVGLLLQLMIVAAIVYWFSQIAIKGLDATLLTISGSLPTFLQDTTVIMIIVAAITCISMICYGASRKYSLSRSFRTLTMGLILADAIILLWIILSLM